MDRVTTKDINRKIVLEKYILQTMEQKIDMGTSEDQTTLDELKK